MEANKKVPDTYEMMNIIENLVPDDIEVQHYWTIDFGYQQISVNGRQVFYSYGDAKGEALKYLGDLLDKLKTYKPKKKYNKKEKDTVDYLTSLTTDEVIELRDKLIEDGDISINERTY